MFTILSPQRVRVPRGRIVQVGNRISINYIDVSRKATVEVESGGTIVRYCDMLSDRQFAGRGEQMEQAEREEVLCWIAAGVSAMGDAVEMIPDTHLNQRRS